ncbi:MAG: hypothetical protein R3B89_05730 [Polyangiaceae bacterium]
MRVGDAFAHSDRGLGGSFKMLIDRTKALLLVGALAAQACVIKESDDGNTGGTAGTGNGGNAGSGGSAGSAGSGTGGSSTAGTGGSTEGTGATAGTGGTTGGSGGATGGSGGATGGTGGATGGTGGATCDDSVGVAIDCNDFPIPTNEGDCDARAYLCPQVSGKLQPGRDEAVADCFTNMTDKCDGVEAEQCVFTALSNSCPDAAVETACGNIITTCVGTVDVTDCQNYMSGLNSAMRTFFEGCMATECDVTVCAEGVLYTSAE